ncbi:DUF6691 family protein [Deinococcus sp.]|uniref:DUF6691 family protein n=1 Tax=Deinococcus sp. TaxID=47478 RepID=UPI002869CD7C|nr:DUF6691 family protein [Deinococcus sp.]
MTRSQAASWYRMQEMFRFESFHMFGIIISPIVPGMLSTWALRRAGVRTDGGEELRIPLKAPGVTRYVLGGVIFGTGWGLASACPMQLFTLLGTGTLLVMAAFGFALLGTGLCGAVQSKLPY